MLYICIYKYMKKYVYIVNITPCAQQHELPQSHCNDNQEGTLLS